jgi:peptide chain release factor 1
MDPLPDIAPFQRRLDELNAQMAEPSFYTNPRRAAEVTREQQKLARLVADYRALENLGREIAEAEALARDPAGELAFKELIAQELPGLECRRAALREAVLIAMIPRDPTDSRNTVMEIRAGTGGEEAALFAAELARLYQKYAEARGWKIEPMGSSGSERGGFREVSFLISGQDVYRQLKFESGVHRVQRVPVTEASGRIHTSTVTVAVLPEAEEVDIHIDPQELEITVQRASGPGGQGVNTTDSAVRIIHRPTGMIVFCADGRSQQKNKASAMAVLRSRLLKLKEDEERAKYAAQRRSQIGTGDRSERIRTYNFPQNRVTDHRIGLTLHNLPQVMEGGIDDIIAALQKADYAGKVAALASQAYPPPRAATRDD